VPSKIIGFVPSIFITIGLVPSILLFLFDFGFDWLIGIVGQPKTDSTTAAKRVAVVTGGNTSA